MSTYGRTRERLENGLRRLVPNLRVGALRTVPGPVENTGEMPLTDYAVYSRHVSAGNVIYTVLSYITPVAYVLKDGTVIIPDVEYSSNNMKYHQRLCWTHLNQPLAAPTIWATKVL